MYVRLGSSPDGVNSAAVPVTLMLPAAGGFSMKVVASTVAGRTGSLKVAEIAEKIGTPVSPLLGLVVLTVGSVVSGAVPVVKVQTRLVAKGLPVRLLIPVVSVTVYGVVPASGVEGVKVMVAPVTANVPLTGGLSVNVPAVTVVALIGSLKVAVMADVMDTPVA